MGLYVFFIKTSKQKSAKYCVLTVWWQYYVGWKSSRMSNNTDTITAVYTRGRLNDH